MKLKNLGKVLMSCVLAGALFTGCGGNQPAQPGGGPDGDVRLGMIAHLNATEKKMDDILKLAQEDSGVKITHYVVTFYNNLNAMQMGLESNSVDQISVYNCVADYLIEKNDKFEHVTDKFVSTLKDDFSFAVRKDDAALKADLDKVIGEMKADGSLDKLVTEYITNVDKGKEPPAVEIPSVAGAETIKIGVTGDLPPLDYVNAGGNAAGFNTALLAEVAKRTGKNIEIVQIESGARAAALSSKQIDVIFWAVVPSNNKIPADIDKPEGVELSTPYFGDGMAHLKMKK